MNIDDLEQELGFKKSFENELAITTESGITVYNGRVSDLQFSNQYLWGRAWLCRTDKIPATRRKWLVKQEYMKENLVWIVSTKNAIFHDGKGIATDLNRTNGYRHELMIAGKNERLKLLPKLFDEVFGPIDKEIDEMYRRIT